MNGQWYDEKQLKLLHCIGRVNKLGKGLMMLFDRRCLQGYNKKNTN